MSLSSFLGGERDLDLDEPELCRRRRRSLESLRDLLRPILPVLAAASSFKLVKKLVTQLVTFKKLFWFFAPSSEDSSQNVSDSFGR